jgi:hypothetical protein
VIKLLAEVARHVEIDAPMKIQMGEEALPERLK